MIKALYVDDEEGLLEIAKHYLEANGEIELSITTFPETALQMVLLGRFDVIISDYQMPKMNGLDLLKALRAKGIGTPFIIFTGRGREEVVIEALNNGADFYLQKGGELNAQFTELRHKMMMVVERSRHKSEIQQFSDIVMRLQSGLFIFKFDGGRELYDLRLQSMNPSALRLIEMGAKAIGKSIPEIMPRITEEQWIALAESILSGRPFHIPNLEYADIKGSSRYYDINASPIGEEGLALIVQEITAYEVAAKEIRENERKYRSVFDNRMLAISVIDAETLKIIDVNDRWCEQYGYDRKEAGGLTQIDVSAESEATRKTLMEVTSVGQGHVDLRTHRKKSGETIQVELNVSTFSWRGKTIITIISHDISQRILAEERLKISERRNEELLKSANSIILRWTPDACTTYINEFGARFFGFEKEELVGKNLIGTITAAYDLDGSDMVKMMRSIGSNPELFIYNENENQKKDGTRVWIRWSNSPILGADGAVKEIVSVGTDITERKRMEIELLASQKELSDIIEFLPDATFVIDSNGIVVAWNRAIEDMSGVKKKDMIGKGDMEYTIPFYGNRRKLLLDLVDQRDQEIEKNYDHIKRVGNAIYAEVFCPALKGGQGAQVWATAAPLYNAAGERIGAIESIRDVTDRMIALEAVRKSEERLRLINDSSADLIYSYDRKGRFTSTNASMCTALRLDESQIIGRTHAELGFPEEQCREWDALHQIVYETDSPVIRETSTPLPDGSMHIFEVILNPLHDASRKMIGIGGTTREITERKMAEEAVRTANHKLNLLSSITMHDILNQLTILQGYLEMAATGSNRGSFQIDLGKMRKAASNIKGSIDLAKEYDALGSERPIWQSVQESFLQAATGFDMQRIDVVVDVDGQEIFADPMLVKVFHNLIGNSIIHGGGVRSISLTAKVSGKGLELGYQDDGKGISEDEREGLFEKGRGRHTGFGLFLSREILSLTGIAIEERCAGQGARFVLTVPATGHRT
jgi:PAS domain S-box-containing protein